MNVVFGKAIENMRKHRYIELATTENYHTTKFSLYTYKQMIFTNALQEMTKLDLIVKIMNWTSRYQK